MFVSREVKDPRIPNITFTAVEVTPITSVDRITVGDGTRGPVTRAIQEAFFGIVRGEAPDRHGWLTLVPKAAGAAVPTAARQL